MTTPWALRWREMRCCWYFVFLQAGFCRQVFASVFLPTSICVGVLGAACTRATDDSGLWNFHLQEWVTAMHSVTTPTVQPSTRELTHHLISIHLLLSPLQSFFLTSKWQIQARAAKVKINLRTRRYLISHKILWKDYVLCEQKIRCW